MSLRWAPIFGLISACYPIINVDEVNIDKNDVGDTEHGGTCERNQSAEEGGTSGRASLRGPPRCAGERSTAQSSAMEWNGRAFPVRTSSTTPSTPSRPCR